MPVNRIQTDSYRTQAFASLIHTIGTVCNDTVLLFSRTFNKQRTMYRPKSTSIHMYIMYTIYIFLQIMVSA